MIWVSPSVSLMAFMCAKSAYVSGLWAHIKMFMIWRETSKNSKFTTTIFPKTCNNNNKKKWHVWFRLGNFMFLSQKKKKKKGQIALCFHHDLSLPLQCSVMAFTCFYLNQHMFRALLNTELWSESVEALYGLFVLIMGLCLSNRHMPPLKPTTSAAGYPSHSA